MKKSFKLLFLAILPVCAALFVSASCGDGGDGAQNGTINAGGGDSEDASGADNGGAPLDGLGEYDFKGRELRILTRGARESATTTEIAVEENSEEVIDDSVYRRNLAAEERFNAKVRAVPFDPGMGIANILRPSLMAGDDEYDLVSWHMIDMGTATTNNWFLNWHELPKIDMDKPWWYKDATDALTVDGKSFFAMSHLCYTTIRAAYSVFFNKRLAENYALDNLYNAVNEGKWTIDYLYNTVKDIYADVNGDSNRDLGDIYGLVTNTFSSTVTYLYAFDNPITKRDADGLPELVINNEKTISILEKLYSLYYETTGVFAATHLAETEGLVWPLVTTNVFRRGGAAFITALIGEAASLRDMEDNFGILPYPKWDEKQEKYYSMVDGSGPLLAIPITVTDTEFVGVMLEALSAESYRIVTPAYYDVALKVKHARDEESAAMMDVVIEGIRFDFGYIYDGWNGMAFSLPELLANRKKDFASYYNANENRALKYYEKVIDA